MNPVSAVRCVFFSGSGPGRLLPGTAALLMVLAGQTAIVSAQVTYRTVALQNAAAPGTGAVFAGFSTAVINNAGNTAFNANLVVAPGSGATFSNNVGLWSEGFGSLSLVARSGITLAPGAGSATFTTFGSGNTPVLNDSGQVAFNSSLAGMPINSSNMNGIWSQDTSGNLGLVIRAGSPAAGTAGSFNNFSGVRFNNTGQVAFVGTLNTGPGSGANTNNDSGIWRQTSVAMGTLDLVAREGSPAVGVLPTLNYSPLAAPGNAPTLNNNGNVAFGSSLSAPGQRAVFSQGSTGTTALVAQQGLVIPGTAGETYSFPSQPIINNSGRTVFFTQTSFGGTAVVASNAGASPIVSILARNGDALTSAGPGVELSTISGATVRHNGADQVAFIGALAGVNTTANDNFAVITQGTSGLNIVARAGSAAPGTGPGVFFGTGFNSMTLNNVGQVAFITNLIGTGIGPGSGNGSGLWATDNSGNVLLVARQGDLFDVDPNPLVTDNRTINLISYASGASGQDGIGRGFNDAGQLVFNLTFTDNTSGVFVATIPAPSAAVMMGMAGLAAVRRRRRR